MRLQVNGKDLKDAVTFVGGIIPRSQYQRTFPYQGIVLSTKDGKLRIQATNLGTLATRCIPAEIEDPEGVLVLSVTPFRNYLKQAGKKANTLSLDGEMWSHGNGQIKVDVLCTTWDELPNFSKFGPSNGERLTTNLDDIPWKKIERFARRGGEYDTPNLQCVYLEFVSGMPRLIAADGFRLAIYGPHGDATVSGLVPREANNLIMKLKGQAYIGMDRERMRIVTSDSAVETVLLEGRYPDVWCVVPHAEEMYTLAIDNKAFSEAIETLKGLDTEGNEYIKMTLHYDLTILELMGNEESQIILDCDWQGEEAYKYAFNGKYMLDILALAGDKILFPEANSNPLLVEHENVTMVLMPMHIK